MRRLGLLALFLAAALGTAGLVVAVDRSSCTRRPAARALGPVTPAPAPAPAPVPALAPAASVAITDGPASPPRPAAGSAGSGGSGGSGDS